MTRAPKRPRDPNQLAMFIVDVATNEQPLDESAVTDSARRGGLKGGAARAAKLSPRRGLGL
ncbi:histone H1 [Methylocella silvestris]|uniref:Histone H1 n=1 Tax=Methylocella silvestris TaxID=199596 RepID=A0A2J7TG15_METSI|nr:histone H1 [Methylocella silvestris]